MTVNPGRKNGRYAVEVGGKHIAPSATTVLRNINKGGMPWAAANETSLFALDNLAMLARLPRSEAYDRLRFQHQRVWDAKRDRGSAVHDMAADWAAGRSVDCPADCEPYLDALEAFCADTSPTWVAVERCVVRSDAESSYGGCFDAIADIHAGPFAGRRLLIDLKTGGRYPAEVTLQLAAYRFAGGMGVYDDAGALVAIEPMPACIDGTAVLYLHDDGTYELLEVPGDESAFEDFLAVRRLYAYLLRMGRWERAHPAPVPVPAPAPTDDARRAVIVGALGTFSPRPEFAANVEALVG